MIAVILIVMPVSSFIRFGRDTARPPNVDPCHGIVTTRSDVCSIRTPVRLPRRRKTARAIRIVLLAILSGLGSLADGTASDSPTSVSLPRPTFRIDRHHKTNSGTVLLSWQADKPPAVQHPLRFELVQSRDSLFTESRVRYTGPDKATYISGLKDGVYYFRVRTVSSDQRESSLWSSVVTVAVRHHSLSLSLTLAGVGGVVFLLTVAVVVHGIRSNGHESHVNSHSLKQD